MSLSPNNEYLNPEEPEFRDEHLKTYLIDMACQFSNLALAVDEPSAAQHFKMASKKLQGR